MVTRYPIATAELLACNCFFFFLKFLDLQFLCMETLGMLQISTDRFNLAACGWIRWRKQLWTSRKVRNQLGFNSGWLNHDPYEDFLWILNHRETINLTIGPIAIQKFRTVTIPRRISFPDASKRLIESMIPSSLDFKMNIKSCFGRPPFLTPPGIHPFIAFIAHISIAPLFAPWIFLWLHWSALVPGLIICKAKAAKLWTCRIYVFLFWKRGCCGCFFSCRLLFPFFCGWWSFKISFQLIW